MTFILTVSPHEAVGLLNGNLASLIRSWEVPLGTAYLAVKKEKPELHRYDSWNGEEWERHYILRKPSIGEWLQNGLVVAKCEITECNLNNFQGFGDDFYEIRFSSLSVLDKPMEVGKFKPIKKAKYDGFTWEMTNAKNGMIAMDDGMYNIGDPLTKLPSRWQKVEAGE